MESKEVILNNLKLDLAGMIQDEIYNFVRSEPAQIENANWENPMTSFRFTRGSMKAAGRIISHLQLHDLIKRD